MKPKAFYLILIPVLLATAILKLFPMIYAGYLPFIELNIARGIFHSPQAGFGQFARLFENPEFRRALTHTIVVKAAVYVVGGMLATAIAWALSGLKSRKLRVAFATLFLIPFFIPSVVLSYAIAQIVPQDLWIRIDSRAWLVVAQVVKFIGIPVLIAQAALGTQRKAARAFRAIGLFLLIQTTAILSSDIELERGMSNLPDDFGSSVDHYTFSNLYLMVDLEQSAAVSLLQYAVQLAITLAVYRILKRSSLRDIALVSENPSAGHSSKKGSSVVGIVVLAICALIVLLPLGMLYVNPYVRSESALGILGLSSRSSFGFMGAVCLAVALHLIMTAALAYPLTVRAWKGRRLYAVFLLCLVPISASGTIQEYLVYMNIGIVHTVGPFVLGGLSGIAHVFVLAGVYGAGVRVEGVNLAGKEEGSFFREYMPRIWKPLLALGVLQFAVLWNAYIPSIMYAVPEGLQSPLLQIAQAVNGTFVSEDGLKGSFAYDSAILRAGGLTSLPPILLFLLFRKYITAATVIGEGIKP